MGSRADGLFFRSSENEFDFFFFIRFCFYSLHSCAAAASVLILTRSRRRVLSFANAHRVDPTAGLIRIRPVVDGRTAAGVKTMPNACLRGFRVHAFSLFLIPREFACKQHVQRPIIILYSRTVITTTCNDNNTCAIYLYIYYDNVNYRLCPYIIIISLRTLKHRNRPISEIFYRSMIV